MVATAFKPGRDVLTYTPNWFPRHPTLSNFRDAMSRAYFWSDVKNSLIIVGAVVLLSLALAFLAALALAKFRFYGRKAFIVVIIGVQMVPLNALIIPLYILLSRAHEALRRLRTDPAAARRARPRRDLDLRVHPGVERVHHRVRPPEQPEQADPH